MVQKETIMYCKTIVLILLSLLLPFSVYSQWPSKEGVYSTISSKGIPEFPLRLAGYRYVGRNLDFWEHPFKSTGTVRVGEGGRWESLYDGENDAHFPSTMNHCDAGVFMIRWRTGNPNVKVWSAAGFDESTITKKSRVASSYGFMYASNCEQPLFSWGKNTKRDGGNLVDIYYDLKFWATAP